MYHRASPNTRGNTHDSISDSKRCMRMPMMSPQHDENSLITILVPPLYTIAEEHKITRFPNKINNILFRAFIVEETCRLQYRAQLRPLADKRQTHAGTHARTPARTPARPHARTYARTHENTRTHLNARPT